MSACSLEIPLRQRVYLIGKNSVLNYSGNVDSPQNRSLDSESLRLWERDDSEILSETSAPDPTALPGLKRPAKRLNALTKGQRIAFYFTLALVFIRFSMIHQLLAFRFHIELYLLYWVGIPVIVGIFSTGAYRHIFDFRPALYWTFFALWLIPASVFSSWRGGSFDLVLTYYRTELIILFAIATLVFTWPQCRWLIYTIALAAVVNICFLFLFGQLDENGRTSLQFGTVANANDYAGHLLFVLPFVLWIVITNKSVPVRIVGSIVLAIGVYQILATASRGAMLGIVAAAIIFVSSAPSRIRRKILLAIPIVLVVAFLFLPPSVVRRIFSFSDTSPNSSQEALESSRIRQLLLQDSIAFTFEHPLLGLGPGQFSMNEGKRRMPGQGYAMWYQPHNSFTQISSENGLPALIFYVGAIISATILLNKTELVCRRYARLTQISSAVLCLRISLVSFSVAVFFLNFGYFFYFPAIIGVIIAVTKSAQRLLPTLNIGHHVNEQLSEYDPRQISRP
jgi:hypothetical protein